MSSHRHRLVKRLFLEALDQEPEKQRHYLDRACPRDVALRQEVEQLLASHEELASGLATPPLRESAARPALPPGLMAGQRVGPYKIVSTLGQGGMGKVYLALRDDQDFRKRVALKVVRPSLATEEVLRRFRQERQILAALDHENIAKLLDGGSTADGWPYFVMEYVEGESIDSYCDSHRLSIRHRLELFRTVCAAVHFAHQNLIVHRDLKPSNILVGAQGVPKLLDFGVAKLLNPELSAERIVPTRFDVRVMTPDYASPEQMRGQPITTATDVYALGVLLYELMTGHHPYPVEGRPLSEVARVICEHEPSRPSTAITKMPDGGAHRPATPDSVSSARHTRPERLRRCLAGDLDNIVLMALRKEPQRRYSSANQLSEDIRRHLVGHPVIARHDTLRYRTRKFVRRHRAGAAFAAAFVALLIAFGTMMAAQTSRAGAERDRAQEARRQAEQAHGRALQEAETARQVSQFLVELFEVSDPDEARGDEITAREILERGARKIERELQGQPLIQARLMDTIGNVYKTLGLFSAAESMLRRALDTREQLLGPDHLEVASSLSTLGEVYRQHGSFVQAEPLHLRALTIREQALGADHPDVARSLNRLAILYGAQGRYDMAEPLFRRALATWERVRGPDHPDTATAVGNLAVLYAEQGRYGRAMPLFRRSLEIKERALGGDHPDVGLAASNLAELYMLEGRYADAEPLYLRAADILERSLGSEHPTLAGTLKGLADLRARRGKLDAAEPLFQRVLAMREKTLAPHHPRRIETLRDYAALLRALERGDEAAVLEARAQAVEGSPEK